MLTDRIEQDVPGCGCLRTTVPVFEKEAIRYDESLYKPPMVSCAFDVDYEEDSFIDYLRRFFVSIRNRTTDRVVVSILVLMVPLALSGCFSDSRISESNRIPQNTLHNPVSLYLLTYSTNADDLKAGFNVFDAETLDFYHNFIMPSVNVFTSANKDPEQIIITTKRTVKDFRVLLIHFNDAKRLYVVDEVIFTLGELTPGIPLVLTGSTMGGSALAAEGFSFVDSYGITRYFAFHMSGYDGDINPNVFEFDPAPDS